MLCELWIEMAAMGLVATRARTEKALWVLNGIDLRRSHGRHQKDLSPTPSLYPSGENAIVVQLVPFPHSSMSSSTAAFCRLWWGKIEALAVPVLGIGHVAGPDLSPSV